jgi:hypothetical protein
MDPNRFDLLSKRFAVRGLSRRQTLQALGAAGLAGALFGLRREPAAADCPGLGVCVYTGPGQPDHGGNQMVLSTGFVGGCWDWAAARCKPCSTTWEALDAQCRQECWIWGGQCAIDRGWWS